MVDREVNQVAFVREEQGGLPNWHVYLDINRELWLTGSQHYCEGNIDREQMHIAHRVVDRKLAIGDTIYWHSLRGERGTPLPAAA